MTKVLKVFTALLLSLFAVTSLTACSSNVEMSSVAAVIDVRTPEEFATGHLDGALNYDWEGPEFENQAAALDPTANYVIYCRSGNRAGQAIQYLKDQGFTGTLTNGGGVDAASSLTKLSIVY